MDTPGCTTSFCEWCGVSALLPILLFFSLCFLELTLRRDPLPGTAVRRRARKTPLRASVPVCFRTCCTKSPLPRRGPSNAGCPSAPVRALAPASRLPWLPPKPATRLAGFLLLIVASTCRRQSGPLVCTFCLAVYRVARLLGSALHRRCVCPIRSCGELDGAGHRQRLHTGGFLLWRGRQHYRQQTVRVALCFALSPRCCVSH